MRCGKARDKNGSHSLNQFFERVCFCLGVTIQFSSVKCFASFGDGVLDWNLSVEPFDLVFVVDVVFKKLLATFEINFGRLDVF